MAESFVDTFKTELIHDRVWRTRDQLELAIVEWIGWGTTLPPARSARRRAARRVRARARAQHLGDRKSARMGAPLPLDPTGLGSAALPSEPPVNLHPHEITHISAKPSPVQRGVNSSASSAQSGRSRPAAPPANALLETRR
jgi:hypothetical protein